LFPEKKKRVLIVPSKFKANTVFTYLSYSIYNGINKDIKGKPINPKNPPENITYDMLIREVGIFLEDEFNTEEELQRQFKKASDKEKEALKSRLWKIWYNIIAGENEEDSDSNPSYKNKKLKRINKLEEESIFELEEESVGTKGSKGTKGTKGGKSSKGTKGGKSRKSTKGGELTEEEKYENFLSGTRNKYIDNANNIKEDNNGYTERDKEIAYFNFADANAKKVVKNSYDMKMDLINRLANNAVKVKDIVCEYPPQDFPYPDKEGFNTLFRPNKKLFLFAMQLPHQFNRDLLFKSMIYLFHKKIYNIADLQGCSDAINRHNSRMGIGIGCNPYDRDCEPRMWERARFITIKEPKAKCDNITATDTLTQDVIDSYQLKDEELNYLDKGLYYDIKIKDMTAGYFWSWNEISKIQDTSLRENSIVVHCLAGAGRTGSVLLYLLMRDSGKILSAAGNQGYYKNLTDRLAKPHFGLNNIAEVIGVLRTYFVNNQSRGVKFATRELFELGSRIMDKETEDMLRKKGVGDKQIKEILEQGIDDDMYDELKSIIGETELSELDNRQIKSQATCSLLRQRLNRIFFFLAKEFKVKQFYTYERPSKLVFFLPDDEFSNPVMRTISDWDNYYSSSTSRKMVREWLN
jgi:hypothetical protein